MRSKIIFLIFLFPILLFSQEARIKGMGSLFLVIEDEDNELNLYNYGKNSAFLIADEGKDWLKINANANTTSGSLHRAFDPSGTNLWFGSFEGLKIIDENQTFKGTMTYLDYRKKNLYMSTQTDIYRNSPFYIMDSTTGTLEISSPSITFEYAANLLTGLMIGTRFSYVAEHGLKNIGAKPEMITKYVSGQIGLAYALTDNIFLGVKFDPFYNYEKIETAKDEETGNFTPVYLYRGFHVFRIKTAEFIRYNRNYGFNTDLQFVYTGRDSLLKVFLSGGYGSQGQYSDDGSTGSSESFEDKNKDGYWQEKGYNINFAARYIPDFINRNLLIGISAKYSSYKSWAEPHQFPVNMAETKQNIINLGAGLSYYLEDLKLRCGIEYHYSSLDTTMDDYVGDEHFSEKLPSNTINFGIEHNTFENIFIRLGYIYNSQDYNHTRFMNITYPTELSTSKNTITFGIAYNIPAYARFDLVGLYGNQSAKDYDDYKNNSFGIALTAKLLVF
jgi:hypothetical protein